MTQTTEATKLEAPQESGGRSEAALLASVAGIAAQCCMDLDANLASANKEWMAGEIPRGAFEYVLHRHTALHAALHQAGYTAKHPIFGFPVRP